MAIDALLKLEGIDGESEDAEHPKAIEIESWEWGATQSGVHLGTSGGLASGSSAPALGKGVGAGAQRTASGTGGSTQRGKVGVSAITITKFTDRSSTSLLTHLFNNKPISRGSIINRKDMGTTANTTATKSLPYLIFDLKQVVVSGFKILNSEEDLLARETITLNFWEITIRYIPQLQSGIKGRESSVTWDVAGALGRDEEVDEDRQRSLRR
jgi:type VI secretion system secreted protein Hcp